MQSCGVRAPHSACRPHRFFFAIDSKVTLRWSAYAAAASAVLATQISSIVFILQSARLNIAKLFMYFMGVGLMQ